MIIAEVGLNHLGDAQLAMSYVNELIKTDIDSVTFQARESVFYEKNWNGINLKLDDSIYINAANKLHSSGKKLGIAIADINYIDFFEKIGVDFYKVIRNDITNFDLMDKLKKTGKEVFVSTGLSSEREISNFVKHINGYKNFKLNHTQLSYAIEDCNLKAIKIMQLQYGLYVSFGSHCLDKRVLYMSLAYNPSDIFFYVKFKKDISYPDSIHAISIEEVSKMTKSLKTLRKAIGTGKKFEMENKMEE